MKPEHLPLLKSVSAPAVHPDGSHAVVAVVRPDFDADSYVGQLWAVPSDPQQKPRRLTRGFRDTAPAFSPDGRVLAFVRAAAGGKPQLHVVEAGGGEPVAVTDAPLGVGAFAWSPGSGSIVFAARTPDDGRYGTVDGVSAGGEDARLITDYQYRMNGVGYTADKPQQLFLIDVPDLADEPWVAPAGRALTATSGKDADKTAGNLPETRQLTTAATDHNGPVFSADGNFVYFTAALHDGHDQDLVTGIYRVAVDAGLGVGDGPEQVEPGSAGRLSVSAVRQSRDGRWLYFSAQDLGPAGLDFVARNTALYVMPSGGGDAVLLSDPETQDIGGPVEPAGAEEVLVLNNGRGAVELLRFGTAGPVAALSDGPQVVTGAAEAGGTVWLSLTDAGTAGDVAVVEATGLRVLTDFSAQLRDEAGVVVPQELTFAAPDGYPVHGWLVRPADEGPHPVLLNIHGGPFAQFTGALFDEAQVYAAAGYAVLMCNPRGSAGYGQAHGRAIKEQMG
ncbi:MAG TPA: acetylxylan esterase, partial [Arthrobacter sp.]|nr:acetylxylan esterase [Arthrobacter sp.]